MNLSNEQLEAAAVSAELWPETTNCKTAWQTAFEHKGIAGILY